MARLLQPWLMVAFTVPSEFFLPCLVVMIITPLAAREPYRLAAVASFRMLMVAISAGSSALISPSYGAPSTTNNGALDALMLPTPRIRMVELLPGCPLADVV